MNTVNGNVLTIRIGGEDVAANVALPSLIHVLTDTLAILREIDERLSASGEKTLKWEIVGASLNSPLSLTIAGSPIKEEKYNRDVAKKCMNGLRRIEKGEEPPPYFTINALRRARKLASAPENGATTIVFSGPGRSPVKATEQLASNVETILKRTFHFAEATLEGRLETLDVHGKFAFAIYDTLTGHRIRCFFDEAMFNEVASGLRQRVAVTGGVKYNRRTGQPISIRVSSLRKLRSSSDLPQFRPGEYIDITEGMDSAEFIRRVRDAE